MFELVKVTLGEVVGGRRPRGSSSRPKPCSVWLSFGVLARDRLIGRGSSKLSSGGERLFRRGGCVKGLKKLRILLFLYMATICLWRLAKVNKKSELLNHL